MKSYEHCHSEQGEESTCHRHVILNNVKNLIEKH